MQTFCVITKKNTLSLYEKDGNHYSKVYLNGNDEYAYSINSTQDCIDRFMNSMAEEYNLDSIGEIDLILIDNEDRIIAESVINAFGDSVKEVVQIEKLIPEIMMKLDRDKSLHISDYGINYDGKKYMLHENCVSKEEFSLLAYTISDDQIIRHLE